MNQDDKALLCDIETELKGLMEHFKLKTHSIDNELKAISLAYGESQHIKPRGFKREDIIKSLDFLNDNLKATEYILKEVEQ